MSRYGTEAHFVKKFLNHRYLYGIIKKTTTEVGEAVNSVGRDIFKAIHEGKWLSIEYRNKQGSPTKHWIGVYDIYI